MQDHFLQPQLDENSWVFVNMASPCDDMPVHKDGTALGLPEHDKFNEGRCLLSRGFLQPISEVGAVFSSWEEGCTGAALGFYAGAGTFNHYVLLAVTEETLELRVHSGAQNGASFMDAGQPQWLTIASAPWHKKLPIELRLRRDGNRYTAYLAGEMILIAETDEIAGDARALFKALPQKDRYDIRHAFLDWAMAEGFAPTSTLCGTVTDAATGLSLPQASVHLAGFDTFFAQTDEQGHFVMDGLPRGVQCLIAAAEGYAFVRQEVRLTPGTPAHCAVELQQETPQSLPRREYNNPSFDRSEHGYVSLNGTWRFAFDPQGEGVAQHWYADDAAHRFDKAIRVPFSWSSLMGFGEEHLACGDTTHESNTMFNNYRKNGPIGWYRRTFTVPKSYPSDENVILHIGACSNVTYVWLDGRYLGTTVEEYGDLTFDLGLLAPGTTHVLTVKALYPHDINSHNMGKQIFWFSSAPGIWQSVWLEHRQAAHFTSFHLRPELTFAGETCATAHVLVQVEAKGAPNGVVRVQLTAPVSGRVHTLEIPLSNGCGEANMPIDQPELWQYRQGHLYTAKATLLVGGQVCDSVGSYVGLRLVETRWLPGHAPEEQPDAKQQYQYLFLNNRPYYLLGILDQCYNAFGIYTYRSLGEEGAEGVRGSIAYDIDRTLAYGYNLSRVHIKENEPLWYHECDKRGLPVWTEHPGNFYATPEDPNWVAAYRREMDGMLKRLHNHPCLVIVSSINESWGVEGRHVSTPWENELRSTFMEENARLTKRGWPHVLVCDNSGFGKTAACEINDFHYYPSDHWVARQKWLDTMEVCYPGSTFNYINSDRGPYAIGEAVQEGRPIYISEFLHINGIDMQLRHFEKIAGYLRMNVASHEVENSGPLTADRFERDYGYVDANLAPLGYDMVNNMDMVVFDHNRIERVRMGETVSLELSTSHFAWEVAQAPMLHLSVTGIDARGRYQSGLAVETRAIAFAQYVVQRQEPYAFTLPEGWRGAYVFATVRDGDRVLCSNYIQLLVEGACQEPLQNEARVPVGDYTALQGRYAMAHAEENACAVTIAGAGEVTYSVRLPQGAAAATLLLEIGAREGKNAVKVTDERKHPSTVHVFWDGECVATLCPEDDPSDERGLFSNACQGGKPFNYVRLGRLGYGERFEVKLPADALVQGVHTLVLQSEEGGLSLYGTYAGRYGMGMSVITE